MESTLLQIMASHIPEVDPDMIEYLLSVVMELDDQIKLSHAISETISPFCEDLGIDDASLKLLCDALAMACGGAAADDMSSITTSANPAANPAAETEKLVKGLVIGEEGQSTAEEDLQNMYLWGNNYKEKTNLEREAYAAESAKDRRKARQQAEIDRKVSERAMRLR